MILNFIIEVKNSNKTSCVIFSIILTAWRVIMKQRNLHNYQKKKQDGSQSSLVCCISSFIKSHYSWITRKIIGTGIVDTLENQKSISEEAALPHDTPSSAGSRIVSWVLDGALEFWTEEG